MGQILHGSVRTTEAVRRAIQHSQESLRALAKRYGVNQKTIAKWKKRSSVCDKRTGPKEPRSTVLTIEEEAIDHRRLSSSHTAAAGRLPLCAAGDDTASDALVVASLSSAPRHFIAAEDRRGSFRQAEVQRLSDRLFPYRHRRGAHRPRQTLYVRGDRPHVEIRFRRTA